MKSLILTPLKLVTASLKSSNAIIKSYANKATLSTRVELMPQNQILTQWR